MLNEAQLHEDEAARDPVGVLQRAFFKYSVAGPQGHVARGHFNVYQRNHDCFRRRVAEEVHAGL